MFREQEKSLFTTAQGWKSRGTVKQYLLVNKCGEVSTELSLLGTTSPSQLSNSAVTSSNEKVVE